MLSRALPGHQTPPAGGPVSQSNTGRLMKDSLKIGLDILQDVSDALPGPVKVAINVIKRIVSTAEGITSNREECNDLVDRTLRVGLVMRAAVEEAAEKNGCIPDDLLDNINKLAGALGDIEGELKQLPSGRLKAAILQKTISDVIKKCNEKMQWEMTIFQVDVDLRGAIQRAELSRGLRVAQEGIDDVKHNVTIVHEKLVDSSDWDKLNALPRAKGARYASRRVKGSQGCLEGTRVDLLKEIYSWADSDDEEVPEVYWMDGLAGTGKTTLACSLAEHAKRKGRLGASFFFARDGKAELHDPTLVFPTIAHQLSVFSDEIAKEVVKALGSNPDVASSGFEEQWEEMISTPVRQVKGNTKSTALVILDALDECTEEGSPDILELILGEKSAPSSFRLKFFITSRPDAHIRSVFKRHQESDRLQRFKLHDINASIVNNDIRLYLKTTLSAIPGDLDLDLQNDWITAQEFDKLAKLAGSLFIVATTAVRFIGDDRVASPREQLDIVLGVANSPSAQPYATLDALYLHILLHLISSSNEALIVSRLQIVLGAIVGIDDPPSLRTIEKLAGLPPGVARSALRHLHSILVVPESDDCAVQIYHPSFPDFLRDPSRCTDARFRIDVRAASINMARWCLLLMNAMLEENALRSPESSVSQLPHQSPKLEFAKSYPKELTFANRFFQRAIHTSWLEDPQLNQALQDFASAKFIFWLDYMTRLVSNLPPSPPQLRRLRDVIFGNDRMPYMREWAVRVQHQFVSNDETSRLLRDSARFFEEHRIQLYQDAYPIYDIWAKERLGRSSLLIPFPQQLSSQVPS